MCYVIFLHTGIIIGLDSGHSKHIGGGGPQSALTVCASTIPQDPESCQTRHVGVLDAAIGSSDWGTKKKILCGFWAYIVSYYLSLSRFPTPKSKCWADDMEEPCLVTDRLIA